MAKRFLVALAILLIGALVSTFLAMVATNGFGSAGVNESLLAVSYLLIGAGIVLLLAWLCTVFSGKLSARRGWRSWVTLLLVLSPALLLEMIALPLVAVILAELSRSL